jgi:hypothetical protein
MADDFGLKAVATASNAVTQVTTLLSISEPSLSVLRHRFRSSRSAAAIRHSLKKSLGPRKHLVQGDSLHSYARLVLNVILYAKFSNHIGGSIVGSNRSDTRLTD